jgi:hypothetical protein
VFIDGDRKLRTQWRAVLYFAFGNWAIFPLLGHLSSLVEKALHLEPGLTSENVALWGDTEFLHSADLHGNLRPI